MLASLCGMGTDMTDNVAKGRSELVVDAHAAFAHHRLDGSQMTFPHTVVPGALQARGVTGWLGVR